MAENEKAPESRPNSRIDELILTRVGEDAVIRPLDGVTMDEVKRYVEAERSRNRRVVVWTGTLLLGVFLFFLVIFLSVGIYVLHTRRTTQEDLLGLRGHSARQTAALAAMSNRVEVLESVQVDLGRLLEQVESSELTRTREFDAVQADLGKMRLWVDSQDAERTQAVARLDAQLQGMGVSTKQEMDSIHAELERLLGDLRAAPALSVAGGATGVMVGLPDFAATASSVTGPDAQAPEAPELTAQNLDTGRVFDVEEVVAFDPGAERREISVVNFPNSDRFEGELQNGLMHGWGIYSYRNGDRYDGEFRDGMKEGRGTMVYANGEKFIGSFKSDVRAGRGSMSFASGDRYVGEFANDTLQGRGTLLYANGNKYAGGFQNGLRHGYGILRFSNGDIYRGEFQEDARTGKGAYVFSDGSQYIGEFSNGRREGQGRYLYTSGEEYTGQFRNGMRNGQGLSTFPNGKQLKGLWEDDKLLHYLSE